MRAVVQRVSRARVTVGDDIVGEIGRGLLVLLGVGHEDGEDDADYLAEKIVGLRVFEDDSGKILVVSRAGVPSKGARVTVTGTVIPGVQVLGQPVGVTIREESHRVK